MDFSGGGMSRAPGSRSGLRTGTLRTAAGQNGANYSGVGLNTNVSVQERPVTQQGMGGIRVGTAGPRRQVQDTSYYISMLRRKCTEIASETKSLQREFEKYQADNSNFAKYERQYEELMKVLRNLEGKLADYNLAMDKSRDGTDPEGVRGYQQQLAHRNLREKQAIDAIFLERQQCEDAIKSYIEKIDKLHKMEEYKVGQLDDQQRKKYFQLVSTNEQLDRAVDGRMNELETLQRRIMQGEATLKRDQYRDQCRQLQKQLEIHQREHDDVQNELEELRLDPQEARTRLLNRVKDDNKKIQDLKAMTDKMIADTETKRKHVAELREDLSDQREDTGDDIQEKYDTLFQRDKEMTEFLQHFDEYVIKELEEQKKSQKVIVGLLEHTSRTMQREDNMPTTQQYSEMKESLDFKQRQLESSESTQQELEKELAKRKGELEKMNTLDAKLQTELSSLTNRIQTMKNEMGQFGRLDDLRAEAADTTRMLQQQKKAYGKRSEGLKPQVSSLSSEYDALAKKLEASEVGASLSSLEQKLRHQEQNIFQLNDFVVLKELETQFQTEREECGKFIDELNGLLIQYSESKY